MARLLRRKWARDVAGHPGQFFLMAAAVFVSVLALTTLGNALSLLNRSTSEAYRGTNPAQATIETDGARPLPDRWPGVETERRLTLVGRIDGPQGQSFPLVLFVVEDYLGLRIGKPTPDSGSWPPADGTMVVEKTAQDLLGQVDGQTAPVLLPGKGSFPVVLAGTVHDPGLAPAWQERTVYAYTNLATARAWLGSTLTLDELKVVFPRPDATQAELRVLADGLAADLQARGYGIREIQVPPPLTHPHQSQMNTIMGIFLSFALLSLVLSAVLLTVLVRSLLQRETRLIGIMKTLGASPRSLVGHYLGLALGPALAGTLAALPLGVLAAQGLVRIMVALLNLGSADLGLEPLPLVLPFLAGLIIPGVLALVPVVQAGRMTVRLALAGPASPPPRARTSRFRLPRLPALAVRNLGRRPGRLALNLGLLGLAGALFLAALSIGASYTRTLALAGEGRAYDLELRLEGPVDTDTALVALGQVPGVARVEPWNRQAVYPASELRFPVTGQYPDRGHGSFTLRTLPPASTLVTPTVTGGVWADLGTPTSTDRPLALNQNAAVLFPQARIGSTLELLVDGQRTRFRLVALVREIGPATAWVAQGPADRTTNAFLIALKPGLAASPEAQGAFKACERTLKALGGEVEVALLQVEWESALGGHVWTLIYALGLMALVIAVVGLLGLSAATGSGVLERTREIAVMRVLGATPTSVRLMILGEAGLQAAAGFLLALVLSWPLAAGLGNVIGMMSFRIPLVTTFAPDGPWIWAAILVLGVLAASVTAARRAATTVVHDALSFE